MPRSKTDLTTTRQKAYAALGVDPNAVAYAAKFTPFFERVPGGIRMCIDALRASSAPEARKFMFLYDNMAISKAYRDSLPLEAFAVAANLTADQMISCVTAAVKFHAAHLGSIKAAGRHAAIVDTSSELAAAGDIDHATLNMKHMGFLPSPKGSQVNVNVAANASSRGDTQAVVVAAPSPEATIRTLVDRFNQSAIASAPAAAQLPESTGGETVESLMSATESREPVTIDANYVSRRDGGASSTANDE